MPNNTENSSAVRHGLIAGVVAVVIWLVVTIVAGSTRRFEIIGALILGLVAVALGVAFSIYSDTRGKPS
jgi:uncharacterized membrane protein (DUF373 family)